ncbi:ApeI family dehydratase [Vibrio gangliei]|uniref:ApeI family dehydratase n=1 Tax=Vibrio gangliei TaxID=2077090 RepID=UPI000D011B71|nr:3-hydroxyacyl-ACP dehydratase [Vibrio gangliei]
MSIQRKPTIIKHQVQDNQVTLWLKVDSTIEDFKGHFAQFPLLPGVTQIDWAVFFGQQYLNAPSQFQSMEVIKFQEPILKNSLVKLELTWHSDKHKLYFHYYSESEHEPQTRTHSSGRIVLA